MEMCETGREIRRRAEERWGSLWMVPWWEGAYKEWRISQTGSAGASLAGAGRELWNCGTVEEWKVGGWMERDEGDAGFVMSR